MADDRDEHQGGSAAGDEAPDLDALAKRYLDLWEDQLRQLSSDPEVARAMARTVELMNAGAAAFAGMMQAGAQSATGQAAGGQSGEAGDEQSADGSGRGARPSDAAGAAAADAGTAAAGDAHGGADVGVDDLARRVAVLEQRIADLEAALGGKGAGSGTRSRRRRS